MVWWDGAVNILIKKCQAQKRSGGNNSSLLKAVQLYKEWTASLRAANTLGSQNRIELLS